MQLIDTTIDAMIDATLTIGAGTIADPFLIRRWSQGADLARSFGSPIVCRVGSEATTTTFHPPESDPPRLTWHATRAEQGIIASNPWAEEPWDVNNPEDNPNDLD